MDDVKYGSSIFCGFCFRTSDHVSLCSSSLRPVIPQAATLCSPRLCSFSTKFKLNTLNLPCWPGDEPPPLSFAVEPVGFVQWLWCRLQWGWGDAEMPR